MPRGSKAKANRKYKRACAAGSSTRGCATSASVQQKGKKYSKKETSSYFDLDIKTVSYDGVLYDIHYKLEQSALTITGVYKNFYESNIVGNQNNEIRDKELKMKIVQAFITNSDTI